MSAPTVSDYLNFSFLAYTSGEAPTAPAGWEILRFENRPNSGMQAVAFKNSTTGEIVIVYEGTNLMADATFVASQLAADAAISNGETPQANLDSLIFAREIYEQAAGSPIYVTGHSLGGGLAGLVGANDNAPKKMMTSQAA